MRHKSFPQTLAAVCLAMVLAPGLSGATDYFTELEVDRIRDTQEVGRRVPLFLQIAELRLAALGLNEGEADLERGGSSRFANTIIRILNPEAGAALEAERRREAAMDNSLADFSRTELLRGYYQALDEAMNNIDDAYERRRGDVRGPLEALREFTERTLPLLRNFEPENEAEEIAWSDAISQAEQALEGATQALEIIPRNEQK